MVPISQDPARVAASSSTIPGITIGWGCDAVLEVSLLVYPLSVRVEKNPPSEFGDPAAPESKLLAVNEPTILVPSPLPKDMAIPPSSNPGSACVVTGESMSCDDHPGDPDILKNPALKASIPVKGSTAKGDSTTARISGC